MRHPAIARKEKTALVVIDVQEKIFQPIYRKQFILENIKKLVKFCQIMSIPIVLTEQYPKGLGQTVPEIRGTLDKYEPISKTAFSCFGSDEFNKRIGLLSVSTLIITGIETHVCVSQTALDGQEEKFDVVVISDAVSSRTEENWKVGLEKLRTSDITISSTEMIMYEILEKAGTPEFKKVASLLR